jgi:putative effector of murein hydrolase LrgA (UPF0299 family)
MQASEFASVTQGAAGQSISEHPTMLAQLGLLMTFQLIGEVVVSLLGIPFPGPLCGMLLLLGYLCLRGGPSEDLSIVGSKLVDNLGLLFVPAGTAIVAYGARKGRYSVRRLIEKYGRNANMMKWKEQLNGDCPKRDAPQLHDRCDLICPDLPKLL